MKLNTNLYIILISFLVVLLTYFAPWWTIPISIFIVSFFYTERASKAFLLAFFKPAIIWIIWAVIKDNASGGSISTLTSEVLMNIGRTTIFAFTGIIIGITSGLAAISGRLLKDYLNSRNPS